MRNKRPVVNTNKRVLIMALFFVVWMLLIVGRLVWLQVAKYDHYVGRAVQNHRAQYETLATRGAIIDRNGKDLAVTVIFDSMFVDQRQFKDEASLKKTAKLLSPLLEIGESDLAKKMTGNNGYVVLARKLDPEKARTLRETIADNNLKAIGFKKETQRFYPNESLAAAVIGYVGAEENGQAGLEQSQNRHLSGKPGEVEIERDGRNQAYERREIPAIGGAQVATTLDSPMQHKIEVLLEEAKTATRAKGAYAVVIDVATGEVLALANAPGFDPNERPKSVDEEARHNRVISWPYEPGSVFKIVTYAAAFEEGKVQPDEKINCGNGEIKLGPRVIHDTHAYGVLPVADAFAKSSNVCAIRLAQRVGKEKFFDYISLFGFGNKTGIELPAESRGIVRPLKRWNYDSIASIAIGQEVSVTLLQAATATATIANKGVWVQPHLIKQIVGSDGNVIYEAKPLTRRVVSQQTAERMSLLMQRVVTHGTARHAIQLANYTAAGKTGTPQKVDGKAYSQTKFMPSFAGFVPATNPRFAIVVMVDEPVGAHQGGSVAAPIFNMIAQIALGDFVVPPDAKGYREALLALSDKYESETAEDEANEDKLIAQVLPEAQPTSPPNGKDGGAGVTVSPNLKPDRDHSQSQSKPSPTPAQMLSPGGPTFVMPDIRGRGIRAVVQACNQLSLNVKLVGTGVAVKQMPAPGTRVRPGEDCKVEFQ